MVEVSVYQTVQVCVLGVQVCDGDDGDDGDEAEVLDNDGVNCRNKPHRILESCHKPTRCKNCTLNTL